MYSKLQMALHGLLGAFCLPVLWVYEKLFGSDSKEIFQKKDLRNYICVVTGANTGVGKETAYQLVLQGATVVIGCRNSTKGGDAVRCIRQEVERADKAEYPYATFGSIECISLDLSCFYSVKDFAVTFLERFPHLDILINNGGMNLKAVNKNGLQDLFMVNYLSHYLLYRLLEPALSTTSSSINSASSFTPQEARVVNLSSVMHHEGNSDFERSAFNKYDMTEPYSYYSDSKLYLNYLTMEINRRCIAVDNGSRRPVTAISVNPGAVRSDIWRHVPWPLSVPYDMFMRIFYLSVQQGAAPSLFAATVPYRPMKEQLLLPYACPYRVHGNILAFEMLGPYAGVTWAIPSVPNNSQEIAKKLYEFSEDLINTLIASEQDIKCSDKKFQLA